MRWRRRSQKCPRRRRPLCQRWSPLLLLLLLRQPQSQFLPQLPPLSPQRFRRWRAVPELQPQPPRSRSSTRVARTKARARTKAWRRAPRRAKARPQRRAPQPRARPVPMPKRSAGIRRPGAREVAGLGESPPRSQSRKVRLPTSLPQLLLPLLRLQRLQPQPLLLLQRRRTPRARRSSLASSRKRLTLLRRLSRRPPPPPHLRP
mmetsp:Transcript_38736/g.82287  ORF Transcript_38736/g.82287 Transcript_38736/m.82287 type:complete len:204 (+) Transcript_38736:109-720(+)